MESKNLVLASEAIYQYALNVLQQMGIPSDTFPLVIASVSSRLKDFTIAELVSPKPENAKEADDDSEA